MKKFLLALVMIVPVLAFTGCGGDDDEPQVNITESDIVGTWTVTQMSQGSETVDIPNGYVVFNLKSDHNYTVRFLDNNYIGTWKLEGNTVVGTTLDPITERLTFTSLNDNAATINYTNSEGDKYVLKAVRNNIASGGESSSDNIDWLNKNIVGEWYGYEYYNSISGGLWIKNEYFKDNKFVFRDDRTCVISGFPYGNGSDMYFIEKSGASAYLKIGKSKYLVFSIDKDKNEIILFNFAKIRKVK